MTRKKAVMKMAFGISLIGCICFPEAFGQTLRVMTYNIRVDIPVDTTNGWNNRKGAVAALINFYKPDILGVQEALKHQLQDILDKGAAYRFVGVGRTDGAEQGEYSAILYDGERLELVSDSTFWLSQTPQKPSRGWDAAYDRVCTFALFRDRLSDRYFWVFNTHLDNVGTEARKNGTDLILQRIENATGANGYPVVLMGDLNCEAQDDPVQHILSKMKDSRTISGHEPYGPEGTFNGFEMNSLLQRRIDYIFTDADNIIVHKYGSIDDRYGMKWPSDHLPVLIDMELE